MNCVVTAYLFSRFLFHNFCYRLFKLYLMHRTVSIKYDMVSLCKIRISLFKYIGISSWYTQGLYTIFFWCQPLYAFDFLSLCITFTIFIFMIVYFFDFCCFHFRHRFMCYWRLFFGLVTLTSVCCLF